MNIKRLSGVIMVSTGIAFTTAPVLAETASTQTTIEKSTTVDVPKPGARVEETTTTKSKNGIFGRKKSETTTSTRTYDRDQPQSVTSSEFRSKTTTETERRN